MWTKFLCLALLVSACMTSTADVEAIVSYSYGTTRLSNLIRQSIEYIHTAYERYPKLAFSFNGGKDCTVLLHLLRAALFEQSGSLSDHPFDVYLFDVEEEFKEVTDFVHQTVSEYNLNLVESKAPHMIRALQEIVDTGINAMMLGVRGADPTGNIPVFAEPTLGWPKLTRVAPIIHWEYVDVWEFLLRFNLPYCSLYDHGFTSLGAPSRTKPNPALRYDTLATTVGHVEDKPWEQAIHSTPASPSGRAYLSLNTTGGHSHLTHACPAHTPCGIWSSARAMMRGRWALDVGDDTLRPTALPAHIELLRRGIALPTPLSLFKGGSNRLSLGNLDPEGTVERGSTSPVGETDYLPAYYLPIATQERSGRIVT
ncbi:Phosphoadenosine phosphosulfate reductase family [Carpediemonas membranifera]|uniref:FAD synthase n=1 Tax=Carpediemonas membranifera TaxID=201153 RepID=A0A8J6AS87_9EUKA|nr:Phosphoadenosine phosphosulfate reductase family [Carpediemonas membranifera]|eukprot:KAG9393136.1 Phosphoadenosine phosphosulfate reductase family [Carpediemonas membranifera]